MSRRRIIVFGANGALGRELLLRLGPEKAIAVTRKASTPLSGFEHVQIGRDGALPSSIWAQSDSVINAAGLVHGKWEQLEAANVSLALSIARDAKAAGIRKLVQVSSFSVYGLSEHIDAKTHERPISDYAKSKAACDNQLSAFSGEGFSVETLRLPFMFSANNPALLSSLLLWADKIGYFPDIKSRPVQRSMITYADAAQIIIESAFDEWSGKSTAADPKLFNYSLMASIINQECEKKIRIIDLPKAFTDMFSVIMPGTHRRILRSSVLDQKINRISDVSNGIENELRKLIRKYFYF